MITKEELEAIKTRVAKEVETPIPANWESHIDIILDEDIPKLIATVEELRHEVDTAERKSLQFYCEKEEARDDALEEAAVLVEDYEYYTLATKIRALKAKN